MGYLGQGNETVPIYLSLYSRRLPIHLQEDKDNCLMFLAFSLLDNKSFSIILMIELFLCNKYLSFFYHGSGQFFCVIVGCACFFCWCLCFWFSFIIPFFFLQFSHFFCSSCCLSSFWVVCLLVLFFPPPSSCFFSFSCVSFSSSPMLFCYFFLSFLLLCMYLVWLFLLLWFLSLFLFLSLCFFFSPAPRAHLNRKAMD